MVADLVPCCVLLDVWFLLRYLVVLLWLLCTYVCCCLYCVALRVVVGICLIWGCGLGFYFGVWNWFV